jgi:hypothetical protein
MAGADRRDRWLPAQPDRERVLLPGLLPQPPPEVVALVQAEEEAAERQP